MQNSKTIVTISPVKDAQVCFRLERILKEELEYFANENGLTVSEALRSFIEEKILE